MKLLYEFGLVFRPVLVFVTASIEGKYWLSDYTVFVQVDGRNLLTCSLLAGDKPQKKVLQITDFTAGWDVVPSPVAEELGRPL